MNLIVNAHLSKRPTPALSAVALRVRDAAVAHQHSLDLGAWERIDTARHFRVFPGEGVHSEQLAEIVRRVDETGYRGDYSFEVFNDDYRTLPLPMVAERARRSVKWLTDQVSRRSLPPRRLAARGERR
jgi:sugar phosphate isomerase/epimerase